MNPKIPALLRWVTAFEVGVLLVAGGGLFFAPDLFASVWPWAMLPFNIRLMGAVYLAAVLSAVTIVLYPYWSLARLVVPMIAVFTVIVLGVSVAYAGRFDGSGASVVLWFGLYIVIPANAVLHLWQYRQQMMVRPRRQRPVLQSGLAVQGFILCGYGLFLLIAPMSASAFWPWALDAFQARLYSVAFITPGIGAFLLARSVGKTELLVLGVTQITGGLLPVTGLVLVDQSVGRIMWSQPDVWLWIGLFGYIAWSGVLMVKASQLPIRIARVITIPDNYESGNAVFTLHRAITWDK